MVKNNSLSVKCFHDLHIQISTFTVFLLPACIRMIYSNLFFNQFNILPFLNSEINHRGLHLRFPSDWYPRTASINYTISCILGSKHCRHSLMYIQCGIVAVCSRGHMNTSSFNGWVAKCQDLPLLEEEGGEDEDLSVSLWSLSSDGTAGLLHV